MRKKWSDKLIRAELTAHIDHWGRMPSARELRQRESNDLACVLTRRGGYRAWAHELGAEMKDSETKLGQDIEIREARFWLGHGCTVQCQSTKAPFDLLVNDHRVDVKSAHLTKGSVYVFAGLRGGVDCDFFDLVCLGSNNRTRWRFIVPASAARIQTLQIRCGIGAPPSRYAQYRDALGSLLKE